MKKISLLFGLVFLGISAFSQELIFTKGDRAPGKLENGRAYEDFINGKIQVTDNEGREYTFVKADFMMTNAQGKKVRFSLSNVWFNEEQSRSIVLSDDEGTEYIFSNVVARNSDGKQFVLPEVKFAYHSFTR